MANATVVDTVRRYLRILPEFGIHPEFGVLYGSFADDRQKEWSDIDVLVPAPEFDESTDILLQKKLWRAALRVDTRIEPLGCGLRDWSNTDSSMIIDQARKHGILITLEDEPS